MQAVAPCTGLLPDAEGCGRESGVGSARAPRRGDSGTSCGKVVERALRASGDSLRAC